MNAKILVPVLIAGLSLAAVSTYAATSNNTGNTSSQSVHGSMGKSGHMMTHLTEAEKTALTSMTDAEKRAFFEKKHTEIQEKREANEAIIDKLLAGQSLTADEEILRKTIITERAERKAQKEKMDAIRTKIQAGQALTSDEKATLDSMPKMGRIGMSGHGKMER